MPIRCRGRLNRRLLTRVDRGRFIVGDRYRRRFIATANGSLVRSFGDGGSQRHQEGEADEPTESAWLISAPEVNYPPQVSFPDCSLALPA